MKGMATMLLRFSLLWLLLLGGAQAAEQGLLWQVSGKGADAFLFGTMHSDDPRVTTLAPPVQQAFDEADTLMLEISLDASAQMAVVQEMMLPEGKSLSGIVGKELGEQTQQAMLGFGVPPEVTERMQPWASVVTLSMPKMQSGMILDVLLYQQAQASGKRFTALETPEEQMGVFTSLSDDEQGSLLKQVLKEYKTYPAMFERLIEAYLQRDLTTIEKLSEDNPMSGDPALQEKMMDKLLDQRNRRMVSRLLPQLKKGSVFVGVGALHLPGEQGLVKLLRQRGYRVEVMY